MTGPVLHGFGPSVYSWIARLALAEKGIAHDWREVDPFSRPLPEGYEALHPFARVPALTFGDVTLYETAAIIRFVDEAFDGPSLQPEEPLARARQTQIIAVADNYAYWPLVRQIFAHGVFRPAHGEVAEPAKRQEGVERAPAVLAALAALAGPGPWLLGPDPSLADIHLAPMIACLMAAPEGPDLLAGAPVLQRWWQGLAGWRALANTAPPLVALPSATR
ncbi:glutathione S-transferase family protein [Radicibacter daui]|uniref:glutathione S-transferase family protein n=1 Tax=Radicibacter daui TaxID=3064829 RepID=UPI004046CD8E